MLSYYVIYFEKFRKDPCSFSWCKEVLYFLNKFARIKKKNQINNYLRTNYIYSDTRDTSTYIHNPIISLTYMPSHYITVTQFQYILTISIAWEFAGTYKC